MEGIAHQEHAAEPARWSQSATAVIEALVVRPSLWATTASVGHAVRDQVARPTIASLVVSPRPTPPVTTISGASPSR